MSRPRKTDDLLVVALGQRKTHAQAARMAGVSERTVRRRLQDPEFVARVDHTRAEVTEAAVAQVEGLYPRAISTLSDLLEHKEGQLRLRAAQVLLKTGPELRAHSEIEDRLLAIEEQFRKTS